MLDIHRLHDILHYDSETGYFTNLVQRGVRGMVGAMPGYLDKDGYTIIPVDGKKYRAGRLAWFYMTGEWPIEIDHVDGVRDNDAWTNLREATRSDNIANSNRAVGVSGLRGVKRDPMNPTLWRARIAYGNYRIWLGPFDSPEEAYEAYLEAAEIHHGEFALHKRNPSLGA